MEHHIVKNKNGLISIIVKCPRCGRFGVLRLFKRRVYGHAYKIVHKNGVCLITPNSAGQSYYDIDAIYKKIRLRKTL